MGRAMHTTRRLVEMALYGLGDQRRYVQDSAIFIEVWIELIEGDGNPIALLLQPYLHLPPPELAEALGDRGISRREHKLVYNNTLVSLSANLADVVFRLAPMTGWFRRAFKAAKDARGGANLDPRALLEFRDTEALWLDVPLAGDVDGDSRVNSASTAKELLSFVRIAGIAAWLQYGKDLGDGPPISAVSRAETLMKELASLSIEAARREIASCAIEGWQHLLDEPAAHYWKPVDTDWIYSITVDRKTRLAVAESRKTVKADAAKRLFDISCSGITWAVIDSGIDGRHPAFWRKPKTAPGKPPQLPPVSVPLAESRVTRTFDFSGLRELLLGDTGSKLPEHCTGDPDLLKKLDQVRQRSEDFQPIDWGLLRPLLEIPEDRYIPPTNRHGTHVAGILGADWDSAPRNPMHGVCPDIELIDVRICGPNGESDEFIVTAALQFLRYLNAHADMMVVHGVNMSLSFEHDVASYACGRTPVCLEAERTVNSGVVVVAAAGNRGYRHIKAADETTFYQFCAVSITDPGNAESVITVGSTHRREPHNFGVSYFSSRGPTGDGRIKPDLVAPGEKIYAPAPHGDAVTLDGTSMAAPHVSGVAALLLARNAELIGQPARIKKILCDTATDLGRERYFQGHGLVDALRALQSV